MNMKKVGGIALAVLSAITFALAPGLCKFAQEAGWGDINMTFVSMALATVGLFLLCLVKKIPLRIEKNELPLLLVASLGCFLAVLMYNMAACRIPAGSTTAIHYLNPALIMIGSILFFHLRITWLSVLSAVLNIAGVFCFFERSGNMLAGSVMAILSAVFYAVYSLMVDYSKLNSYGAFKLSFYITAFSAVFCAVTAAATGNMRVPAGGKGFLWVLLLAITSDILGILFFQSAIGRIGATSTSMTATLEPLTSIILGAIFFHEALNARVIIGCLLIIAGVILNAVSTMQAERSDPGQAEEN